MRRASFTAVVVLLLLATALDAATIPLSRYIQALEAIRSATPEARAAQSRLLMSVTVESPNGDFTSDGSLLEAIATHAPDADARLDATLAALRSVAPAHSARPDPRVIERLRRDETASALHRGGEVSGAPKGNEDALTRWFGTLEKIADWIWKKMETFSDWVMSWWPQASRRSDSEGFAGLPFLVIAVVIAIIGILTVLALEVIRRSRKADFAPKVASLPLASKKDEDPLSRQAGEWEQYAAQLAAAGRLREAIRAWYHAVLVTLYSAGALHFRKGRTNWEYVAALSPAFGWRESFVELTRSFETEWYGHPDSTEHALDECSDIARRILVAVRRGVAA